MGVYVTFRGVHTLAVIREAPQVDANAHAGMLSIKKAPGPRSAAAEILVEFSSLPIVLSPSPLLRT
jgi:hypothetical protein